MLTEVATAMKHFNEGQEAFRTGRDLSDNPYYNESIWWMADWEAGWAGEEHDWIALAHTVEAIEVLDGIADALCQRSQLCRPSIFTLADDRVRICQLVPSNDQSRVARTARVLARLVYHPDGVLDLAEVLDVAAVVRA